MNRLPLLIGALLGIPLILFLGLSFEFDPNKLDSPLIGGEAPRFTLEGFDGEEVRLGDLRGQPVVLNFWATWCQPCVYEHPYFVSMSKHYDDRIHFVGVIAREDSEEAVRRFRAQLGSWGASVHDDKGQVSIAYGVFKLPTTYLIDADGVVQEKIDGPVTDPEVFRRQLEALL